MKSIGGPAHSTLAGFLAALTPALKVDDGLYKTKKYDIPAATCDTVARAAVFLTRVLSVDPTEFEGVW